MKFFYLNGKGLHLYHSFVFMDFIPHSCLVVSLVILTFI